MSAFWGSRKRDREQRAVADADLARRADAALIAADERLRVTRDELAFAQAELGDAATTPLRVALESVRTHLGEAFHLNQLNHDEIPDTEQELRERNARIVQLCDWAEGLLDERTEQLAEPIARARNAPQILAGLRSAAARLRTRLPEARAVLQRLAARYSAQALARIDVNPAEAEQLLDFAEHSAGVTERRREAGQRDQANLALEAATESVRRATTLIDAVENYEIEALKAEATLGAVVEDSRSDLVAAGTAPQTPQVQAATAALAQALAALPAAGVNTDPFALLTGLREANTALDAAVDHAREQAARPVIPAEQVRHAIDDADRQLAILRDVIGGHRGWIGADARTRQAEAERIRGDLDQLIGTEASLGARPVAEADREQALALARRVGYLAGEALQLTQRDIDTARPQADAGWGTPQRRGGAGGGMGDAMGGILGGLVIGSILGDIFD